MKKRILITLFLVLSITISYAQYAVDINTIPINTSKSELKWYGENVFYFGGHYGTIQFKKGEFIQANDKITGGTFIIDMNTIINTDGEYMDGLVKHLKNEDFFDVPKYPTSHLVITEVYYHDKTHLEIRADLTIKGITQPIKFQAEVNYELKEMKTKFKIDRTRWGITYNSKLKDNAISDAIGFEVTLRVM